MSGLSRRNFLGFGATAGLGIGLRAALTGLPASFFLPGAAYARTPNPGGPPRIVILATSSEGEPINVCGPGTYGSEFSKHFTHPKASKVNEDDVVEVEVNQTTLGVKALQQSAEVLLGDSTVEMASGFNALSPDSLKHLVWFNYRSGANIHPQFKDVLTCFGQVTGPDGRGEEQLPASIAQEMSALLGTTTAEPIVLGKGAFSIGGSSLANYSPTKLKTLAQSVGKAMGGADNFATMYDLFLDEAYHSVYAKGTAQQRRFFEQQMASREQAAGFGAALSQLLEGIEDDSIQSQMRCAAFVAKLRLAPVVLINTDFGGDNHQDPGLINEINRTLAMIEALDIYWKEINELDVADDVVLATLDVFGRDPRSDGNGRSHYGDFVSGLLLGSHLQGGVVGGFEVGSKGARATGISAVTGTSSDSVEDIGADATLAAYYRTIMDVAGVPVERQEERLPTGTVVSSVKAPS